MLVVQVGNVRVVAGAAEVTGRADGLGGSGGFGAVLGTGDAGGAVFQAAVAGYVVAACVTELFHEAHSL